MATKIKARRGFTYLTGAGNERSVKRGDILTVTDTLRGEWHTWDPGARQIVAINGKRVCHFGVVRSFCIAR